MKRALTTIILGASLLFATAASADRVSGSIPPSISAGDIPPAMGGRDLDIPDGQAPVAVPRGHIERAVPLPSKPVKRAVPLPELPVKRAVPLPPGAVIRNATPHANAPVVVAPPSARLRKLLEQHFGNIDGELRCQVRITGNLREIDCHRTITRSAPAPQAAPTPAPAPQPVAPQAAPTPAPAPAPKAADVAPAKPAVGSTCGMTDLELRAFNLLNKLRANSNLGQLTCDRQGVLAARKHSQDMCTRRYFSHVTPEGRTPWHRLRVAGAKFKSAGENIAMGYSNAQDAHDGWVTSPGHFRNMVNGKYTRAALGVATCGNSPYWTQLFMN